MMMKVLTALIGVLFSVAFLTGCQNTATGFTKDVSKNTAEVRKEINEN